MKPRLILLSALLICVSTLLRAQIENSEHKKTKEQINSFMQECYERGLFNGCVLVTQGSEIIYNEALGYADIFKGVPLEINSKFDIGSLTKSFTATCIMILEEQGKLSYEDKLSTFFPQFPKYAGKITIHHLLVHQSGIRDYINELAMHSEDLSSDMILQRLIEEKLLFKPGSNSFYSNSGYFLLARIIEKISGKTYAEFLEQNIFRPLEMSNSIVCDSKDKIIEGKAIGRNFKENDENPIYITGDGGIYTTTGDLYKWHLELYNPTIVSKESMERATTAALLSNGRKTRSGYGWRINEQEGVKIIKHGGATPGYITYFLHPETFESSITLLTNFFLSDNFRIVLNGLIEIATGSNPQKLKTPAMYKLNKYVLDNGVSNLNTVFKKINSDTTMYKPFGEVEFIQLSSFYKNRNKYKEAIALLEIYKNEFPNSIIPYDELLEIYEKNGTDELLWVTKNDRQLLKENITIIGNIEIQLHNRKTKDSKFSLNVRFGPGMDYEIISQVKPGKDYIVVGKSMNGEWLKLKHDGWVSNRRGRMTEDQFNSIPFIRFEEK